MQTLLHPRDTRWHGPQRWYFAIDLFKIIILQAFIVLIIIETVLYRKWYNAYHSTVEYDSDETALDFFARIGIVLIPDIFSIIITHSLLPNLHFHPVYALTQALIVFCMYPIILTFNVIIVMSNETGIPEIYTWRSLCFAEMGLQAVLMVCWLGLVVCSCIAVHRWRAARREESLRGVVREEMELKNVGVGEREHYGNFDAEGNGLVDDSVKSSRVFV